MTCAEEELIAAATAEGARRISTCAPTVFKMTTCRSSWNQREALGNPCGPACLAAGGIDEAVAARQRKAQRYRDALVREPGIRFQEILPDASPTYKDLQFSVPSGATISRRLWKPAAFRRRNTFGRFTECRRSGAFSRRRTILATRSPSRMPSCVCRCSTSWPTPTSTG